MFILAYVVIIIMKANSIQVPELATLIVGIIALLEALLYIGIFITTIISIYINR